VRSDPEPTYDELREANAYLTIENERAAGRIEKLWAALREIITDAPYSGDHSSAGRARAALEEDA